MRSVFQDKRIVIAALGVVIVLAVVIGVVVTARPGAHSPAQKTVAKPSATPNGRADDTAQALINNMPNDSSPMDKEAATAISGDDATSKAAKDLEGSYDEKSF